MKDFPSLIVGRWTHACAGYEKRENGVDKMVSIVLIIALQTINHNIEYQVYLVTGGVSSQPGSQGRLDTTEVLVEGGTAWRQVGKLPTSLGGLTGVSMNNEIYMIGMICFKTRSI